MLEQEYAETHSRLLKENRCPLCGYFLREYNHHYKFCEIDYHHRFSFPKNINNNLLLGMEIWLNNGEEIFQISWRYNEKTIIKLIKSRTSYCGDFRYETSIIDPWLVPIDEIEKKLNRLKLLK